MYLIYVTFKNLEENKPTYKQVLSLGYEITDDLILLYNVSYFSKFCLVHALL